MPHPNELIDSMRVSYENKLQGRIRELEQENADLKDQVAQLESQLNCVDEDHIFEFVPIMGIWRLNCKKQDKLEQEK